MNRLRKASNEKKTVVFLKSLSRSWHFKVFIINFVFLLILSSSNYWLFLEQIPNSGDSILYIVHVHSLKDSLLKYLLFPDIDMLQYGGIPVIGAGSLLPFVPLVIVVLLTGEVFAYKLFSILLVAAAGGTMSYYTHSLIHSRIASLIAGIVYVWNPPMLITGISEGHFDLIWFYALIPLLFVTTLYALKKTSLLSLGIAGAILGLVLFGHAEALLIIGPFYLLYAFFLGILLPCLKASRKPRIFLRIFSKKVVALGIVVATGFLLASVRLFPLIFEIQNRYSDVSVGDINSMLQQWSARSLLYALVLRVPSGHGDPFFFDPTVAGSVFYAFALTVPILAIIAVLMKFRDDSIKLSFMLGLLAAFFAAGPNAPQFFQPFMWVFQNIPFYNQMRTAGRFDIVVAFFFAFLCGVAVKEIAGLVSTRISRINAGRRHRAEFTSKRRIRKTLSSDETTATKILVASIFCIILTLNVAPALVSSFKTYDFPTQLMNSYQFIGQQQGDFRFIGLPVATYVPDNVYGISTNPDCYAPILTGKPNLFGDGSGASKYLVNFLYYYLNSVIGSSISFSIGKLLGLYNTRWIILHRPMLTNESVGNLLGDPTLRVVYASPDNSENVLQNVEEPYPLIYNARNMLLFGGPDSILAFEGLDQFDLNSPTKWVFTLANQLYPLNLTINTISTFDAVGFRESNLASVVALQYGISAAGLLASSGPTDNGWVENDFGQLYARWIPRYFVSEVENLDKVSSSLFGSHIEAIGSANLSFNININNNTQYEFWIRAWSSDQVGNLSLTVDKASPSGHGMNFSNGDWESGWHWLNAGTLNLNAGVHTLTIRSEGLNSLDAVMVIPKGLLNTYASYLDNILGTHGVNLVHVLDAHNSFTPVNHSWTPSLALKGNTSTGRCFSTSIDGASAYAELSTPVSGNYSLAIRLLQRQQRGTITFYLDNVKLLDFKPQGPDQWITKTINSSIYISHGYHNFTILNTGINGNDMDKLIIAHIFNQSNSTNFYSVQSTGNVFEFKETSPGTYSASIELTKPSLVVFNAAFHPGWHAFDGKSEYVPVPVNYFVNGFYINNTGRFTLTIVFGLNPPRIIGFYLSIVGLVSLAIIVVYGKYGRRRR